MDAGLKLIVNFPRLQVINLAVASVKKEAILLSQIFFEKN